MPIHIEPESRASNLLGVVCYVLAFITLALILYYFYVHIRLPIPSFSVDSSSGVVLHSKESCEEEENCLRKGDQLVRIGIVGSEPEDQVLIDDYLNDRTIPIFEPFKGGEPVEVHYERFGRPRKVVLYETERARGFIALATLLLPLLFWSMGTVTTIFLRPRDERWLVLLLFQFDTALWTSSGFIAFSQEAYSSVVFRIFIWLFLPLSIHLHLVLPNAPFKRFHRAILLPLYALAVSLVALDLLHFIPGASRLATTFFAMLSSLAILLFRQFVPAAAAERIANRVMFYGVGLGLGPIILLIVMYWWSPAEALVSDFATIVVAFFLVISPLWPLTYIYSIYRNDLGTFEFRSNRLLALYGFFAVYIATYLGAYNLFQGLWSEHHFDPALLGLALSLAFVISAPAAFRWFQKQVDHRIFGIKYTHHEVISAFAARIPAAYNLTILRGVIIDEILPTLMIRKSALYELNQDVIEVIYEQEVSVESLPRSREELVQLVGEAGRYISFSKDARGRYSWVRLIVPLSVQDEVVGIWLLGRRDPDDFYPNSDIVLLTNLANQIAPVIENVRLVEQARQEVQENRRLQQQLVHSQKMEAIGRLSAGVAHDFNNILSVIIGYSNLVLRQYGDDKTLGQAVANIKDAGERAATLTKQLLAFSRKQVMEVQLANLNAVVADVEKMLARLAGEDIELLTRLETDLPNVRVDPGQMGQVVINLAVNARDAMPNGGQIVIETKALHCEKGSARHEGVPPGEYVVLTVEDNGSGVDPEIKARMFEPYFTTKEMGKGTGLGLSMVYGIIEQSAGHIFVDSELGHGTRFTIYLPVATADTKGFEIEVPRSKVTQGGTETILLVEDEASVREVTSEILRSNGYQVIVAEDGEEAIAHFESAPREIDLLLTDVVMPQMKGPELARRLQERAPNLRVVYMSGYNEESILGKRIGEEGSILIQKPFSPNQLASRIRDVLDAAPRSVLETGLAESAPRGPSPGTRIV